jgi:diguanylate cyclase (GGDEF)-like protein
VIRFVRIEVRIVVFFVILLVCMQGVMFALVSASGQHIAERRVRQELATGERLFRRLVDQSNRRLSDAASVLAADFAFREAVATRDLGTIQSVLRNHGARISADVVLLADLEGMPLADTLDEGHGGAGLPQVSDLLAEARGQGKAHAITLIDGIPHQVVVVPVLAPVPIAWVAMGFKLDDRAARDLQDVTALQVSFLSRRRGDDWRMHASTLPDPARMPLLDSARRQSTPDAFSFIDVGDDQYATLVPVLGEGSEGRVVAVLQRSLREGLEPFHRLRNILAILAAVSIVLSIAGSMLIARSVTRPVGRLVTTARRIQDGDYPEHVAVERKDEIGELASSFNHMLDGIKQRESQILRLAYEDALTGLPNRAMLHDRLTQALSSARRTASPVSVMVMGLDRFKEVNETLGHPIGDRVLREVAVRLQTQLRESDTVARLGGDEFAILLPTGDSERVENVVRQIVTALETPIVIDDQAIDVGGSIGVASFPDHADSADTLLRQADMAMSLAKQANSGYALYDPAQDDGRRGHLSLLGELRRAVERDELSLHFQPKLDLATGAVRRAEALVRWQHPVRGFVPPVEFIPFAERTGYIRQVTRWVVERAILQAGEWHRAGRSITISANVSTRDLMTPDLVNLVTGGLQRHGTPASLLCLEITESGFMDDPTRALETLEQLHAIGVRLSIDDFGTGYSSLAYLKKLPVQELKIDRAFVMHMVTDRDDATLVRSTIELGHNLGLEVVAEGVEDAASLDMLRVLGCNEAQGYFISKPLPADRFEQWLDQRNSAASAAA